jgi:DNA-binding MarR family transcriptional regulator
VPKVKSLTDDDYAALAEFRYVLRRFLSFSETEAGAAGLTPQQHQTLLTIRAARPGTATVGYVAEQLVVKPHSATGLVDRLAALELVERSTPQDDRRRAILSLTPKAEAILSDLTLVHREEIERLLPLLRHVRDHFEAVVPG